MAAPGLEPWISCFLWRHTTIAPSKLKYQNGNQDVQASKSQSRKSFPFQILIVESTPNTNHITCRHLKLSYQFILSSRHNPGINLRYFPFNFPYIPPLLPSSCYFPCWLLLKIVTGTIFSAYSHTFILFWLRKTSVSVKMYQLSFHVLICAFHPEISTFFDEFPLFISIFVIVFRYCIW